MDHPTRRRMLSTTATAVGALAALAGCTGDGGDDATPTGTDDGPTTTGNDGGPTTTHDDGGTTTEDGGGTTTEGGGGTTTTADDGTTGATTPPDAEFQFVYDAETLLMAHGGVEAFTGENTDRLEIRVDGENRTTWELPVEPGDQNSVAVAPGSTVEVVWIGVDEVVVATHET